MATELKRNKFIVSKALKNFVLAAVLTAAATQLAHTADSMIVGHIVGPDAVSAINLVLPFVEVLNCMGFLICFGSNAMCAQAIGCNDKDKVARTFTSTLISVMTFGLFVSLAISFFSRDIVAYLSDDPRLDEMAYQYIHTYALGGWLQMMSYGLCLFVATDGRPRIVTKAVVAGALANGIADVVFIWALDMGVMGAALGSLSMFIFNILILTNYLRKPTSSYKLKWPGRDFFSIFLHNIKEGAPITLSNSLMAVTILVINAIVLHYLGADGLFLWSVCLQMLLLSYVFIDGIIESLFAVGGILVGERDLRGLQILVREALVIISVLVAALIVIMYIPGLVGLLFGVTDATLAAELNHVLRIFALMLIPFATTQILLSAYQLVGHEEASVTTAAAQTISLVLMVWLAAESENIELWWGYAIGAALVLLAQLTLTYIQSRRQHSSISALTMIPNKQEGYTFDRSIPYQTDDVYTVLQQIDQFLKTTGIDATTLFEVNLCCEELMTNIAKHSAGHITHHSFDVHFNVTNDAVFVTIKDAGKPFDPIKAGKMADPNIGNKEYQHLGLRLVTNIIPDITYKYMYGQNTVFIYRQISHTDK